MSPPRFSVGAAVAAFSVGAAVAALPGMGKAIQLALREEEAGQRLLVTADPYRLPFLLAEVDRRADLARRLWTESPRTPPDMTARCYGLESVYHDVVRGWLL